MPILACQLSAHHLGKHVHRALTTQLHPWVGARHVPQLLSVLWALPSSFVLIPYHARCRRRPSLSFQLQKSLLSSQQLPPLPSHALLLCSAISELLKASSRQCVQQAVCARCQWKPSQCKSTYWTKRLGSSLPVPPSHSKDKHSLYSITLLPDHTVTLKSEDKECSSGLGGARQC